MLYHLGMKQNYIILYYIYIISYHIISYHIICCLKRKIYATATPITIYVQLTPKITVILIHVDVITVVKCLQSNDMFVSIYGFPKHECKLLHLHAVIMPYVLIQLFHKYSTTNCSTKLTVN